MEKKKRSPILPSLRVDKGKQKYKGSKDLFPSGSVLLNLALAENPYGGYVRGTMPNIVGDTHAGKSFLVWAHYAEMHRYNDFDDYELVYNDTEASNQFDLENLFGAGINKRVKHGAIYRTRFLGQLNRSVSKRLESKRKFSYATDSFDGLMLKKDIESDIEKQDYERRAGVINKFMRKVHEPLEKSKSLFFVVSQTRKKIGLVFGFNLRRTGGDSLDFYAHHIFWLSVAGPIIKNNLRIGTRVKIHFTKNKRNGNERDIQLRILNRYGLDDIGSIIDWMVEERLWECSGKKKSKGIIDTGDTFINGTESKLIRHIEKHDLEDDLTQLVYKHWQEREAKATPNRKPRY